jgi:exonuclease SbcC
MIPVRLQLQNFMSYGTEAPPLDFRQFQVACLSGRNGQGKSALLDAVTWALWGEARKASGNRKPDADLLRIGASEMRVELIFDVEGERYRVERSYRDRGKTSTSGLELQTLNPQTREFQALTEGKMRETQAAIDNVIGLSYDTFINSVFLLQGRSDEFTQKRPSQRKEILVNVLELERYEKLAERARAHRREAKSDQEQAARDVERLESDLEQEDEWKVEYEQVKSRLSDQNEALKEHREREEKLSRELMQLENKAEEADKLRRADEQREKRIAEAEDDAEELTERIEAAEALEEKSDEIEAAHERWKKLKEERNDLDEKRDLHGSIERQIQQKQNEREKKQGKLENKIHRLQTDVNSLEERLGEIEDRVEGRDEVESKLEEARAASEKLEDMKATREKRDKLQEKQRAARETVATRRDTLKGKLESLRSSMASERDELPDLEALREKRAALEERQSERDELQQEASDVKERGQSISEAISEREGTVEALRRDLEEQKTQQAAFTQSTDEVCPTCGTELTPRHRREVEANFQAEIERLEERIDEGEKQIEEHKDEREKLRERYQTLQEKLDGYGDLDEKRASVNEKIQTTRRKREALEEREEEATALKKQIENKDFAQDERERWKALKEEKAALSFDEERYEELQRAASQEERYEEQHQKIEQAAARREPVQNRIETKRDKLQTLREQLSDGSAFEDIDERLAALREQLEGVDFDPERFQEVRSALNDLDDATTQRERLSNARKHLSDWRERRRRAREQAEEAREKREEAQEQLAEIEEALAEKPEIDEKRKAAKKKRAETEDALNDLRTRKGRLEAMLDDAEEKRERLEEHRENHQEAKHQRHLYDHLNDAFGKDGIPSLIIEQTIPEIEERANELLHRLTDGRMNVRLETLGQKKTGGTKETLDIIISDEQGVARPYETFSGGESFRVNFALRVALSQLLAERSGTRIRTLVVDEGFGTQDAEGVQNLVEAIQTAQDDFAKILVITHLKDLKEAFPVRIEVEKDPATGSDFDLIGV